MALTQAETAKWLFIVVRLSRKAYYPGAVVSGVITMQPAVESEEGEYISILSAQVSRFLFVSYRSSMVTLGSFRTLRSFQQSWNEGNRRIMSSPTVMWTSSWATRRTAYIKPALWLSIVIFHSSHRKPVVCGSEFWVADFFQITLPKDIPPSIKTNCVRYLCVLSFQVNRSHLLSFCFSDKKSESHFISIPLNVLLYPLLPFLSSFTSLLLPTTSIASTTLLCPRFQSNPPPFRRTLPKFLLHPTISLRSTKAVLLSQWQSSQSRPVQILYLIQFR